MRAGCAAAGPSAVMDGAVQEEINPQAFAGGELGGVSILKILNECGSARRVAADTSLQPALPARLLARCRRNLPASEPLHARSRGPGSICAAPAQPEPPGHGGGLPGVKAPTTRCLWGQSQLAGLKGCPCGLLEAQRGLGFGSALRERLVLRCWGCPAPRWDEKDGHRDEKDGHREMLQG